MKKLDEEQQQLTEDLFQLNHAYLMLDGINNSLQLANIIQEMVRKVKHAVKEEQLKLLETVT